MARLTMLNLNQSNYWLDTVQMPTGTPGDPPERVDVAVVGAGFTGLSLREPWLNAARRSRSSKPTPSVGEPALAMVAWSWLA